MKKILTILSYLPLLIVGTLMTILIRMGEHMFIVMKIFACVGVFAILYAMYRFTGYLHKKIDERFNTSELYEPEEEVKPQKKLVLVYGNSLEHITFLYMKKCTKDLIDSGVEVIYANRKKLYFETKNVKVQYVTKDQRWRGLKCDEAFGFNGVTTTYLRRGFRNRGWKGSLTDYVLSQENN